MNTSDSGSAGRLFRTLLLGIACALAAQSAMAQVLYGSLMGEVVDPSRAVLPGATVTVTNNDTGLQRETTTDGERLVQLPGSSGGHLRPEGRHGGLQVLSEGGRRQ